MADTDRPVDASQGVPAPTDVRQAVADECARWRRVLGGEQYVYGTEPGAVVRRAVRYHSRPPGSRGTALDAGCGEGQDTAWLASSGYRVTAVEFTHEGAEKTRELLRHQGQEGQVLETELVDYLHEDPPYGGFDLVLSSNCLQFLGPAGAWALDRLAARTAPGGILAVSLFGRQPDQPEVRGTVWFTTLEDVLATAARHGLQPLEAANLWQWGPAGGQPQQFVTAICRRGAPRRT